MKLIVAKIIEDKSYYELDMVFPHTKKGVEEMANYICNKLALGIPKDEKKLDRVARTIHKGILDMGFEISSSRWYLDNDTYAITIWANYINPHEHHSLEVYIT